MLVVFFKMFTRLSVGLLSLIVYMNLLGRMQLAPKSAIDQIGNYILGGILGGIIYNLDLEFYKFFMAIVIWTVLMLFISYITDRSLRTKRAIKGKPTLLMEENIFNVDEFEKNKINLDDIISTLHQRGIYTIRDVDTIWLEPNGQLTVIKKGDDNVSFVLIENGHINDIDMYRLDKNEKWLKEELSRKGIKDISEVFYAEYLDGELFIY